MMGRSVYWPAAPRLKKLLVGLEGKTVPVALDGADQLVAGHSGLRGSYSQSSR